jgi:uncharacterized protein (TIGR00288 family)
MIKKEGLFIPPKNKNDLTQKLALLVSNKRVGVYIDSANLYYSTNKANIKLDYFQIAKWFRDHCNLTCLNFYTAYDPQDDKQQSFFDDIEKAGYKLIKKPIKVFGDMIKGNMDIELAVDALMNKDNYDIIVLISGDGDFFYLVQALEHLSKKTIILGVGGFTSYELHQEADNYFFLNRISNVWQKQKKSQSKKQNKNSNIQPSLVTPKNPDLATGNVVDPNANLRVKVKLLPKPKIFMN